MPHQLSLITTLPGLSQTRQDTTPHDTRNGEDTRGTLQVLFLCTIKLVVFIVDISNMWNLLKSNNKDTRMTLRTSLWCHCR